MSWTNAMRTEYAKLLGLQSAIVITGTAIAYLVVSPSAGKSFAYGSIIALTGALLLTWRLKQSETRPGVGAEWVLRHAYKVAIERFAWAIIMLAIGFKLLELAPLWLLAGFVVGQVAWLFVPVWIRLRTQK